MQAAQTQYRPGDPAQQRLVQLYEAHMNHLKDPQAPAKCIPVPGFPQTLLSDKTREVCLTQAILPRPARSSQVIAVLAPPQSNLIHLLCCKGSGTLVYHGLQPKVVVWVSLPLNRHMKIRNQFICRTSIRILTMANCMLITVSHL